MNDFEKALSDFFNKIAKELRIYEILDWIAKKLKE